MKHLAALLSLTLALMLAGLPAVACGPDTDCRIGDRNYRIYLPKGQDGAAPMGALIFAHGYKGSAAGTMRNGSLRAMADRLGIALVAANARGDDWRLPGTPSGGVTSPDTELAYFDALRADILDRNPIDPDRIVMAGFSAGGMMTWTLACHRPADYAGFIPVAGTFWAPTPDSCTMPPADIIHVHGTSDRIVPLAGRAIGEARQGDVETVLSMYRKLAGHEPSKAPALHDGLTCEAWTAPNDTRLVKCLHPGGHSFRTDWIAAAWGLIFSG
ncbi:alpha/beta hydrolase family esterase [Roseovarius atlanticus]|uniref:alpha/beta hydrolase family esterase n=1 Tax=Roseovarius atlanticus TaxID=1641875 RepID=UPI001C95C85B|nr:PHB depolymerase family esterase [Roseovarius atlanticus]MBY5986599.1 prolyl oligopeptidase family serine peptidase [Roseovarius atlanticus]MBY6125239.1 prolyl oligopeptidase family serine peptidase [Roseovarius atlanticus]MBY6150300.1 prolyl oligopeptidase family serine peptidase [Roseovarius atlanticus]